MGFAFSVEALVDIMSIIAVDGPQGWKYSMTKPLLEAQIRCLSN